MISMGLGIHSQYAVKTASINKWYKSMTSRCVAEKANPSPVWTRPRITPSSPRVVTMETIVTPSLSFTLNTRLLPWKPTCAVDIATQHKRFTSWWNVDGICECVCESREKSICKEVCEYVCERGTENLHPVKHKIFVWHSYNVGQTSKPKICIAYIQCWTDVEGLVQHCKNGIQMFCAYWLKGL